VIRGVGIDMVDVNELKRLHEVFSENVFCRIFTPTEMERSRQSSKPIEYLAERFAVKEAVFKAVAHRTTKKSFDFRIVETLNRPDGYPYVNVNDRLQAVLDNANVGELFISITTQNQYITAIAIAEERMEVSICQK